MILSCVILDGLMMFFLAEIWDPADAQLSHLQSAVGACGGDGPSMGPSWDRCSVQVCLPRWYKNLRVDELLQQARRRVVQDERAKFYEEAARLIVEDAPDIWVYTKVEYPPLAKQVQGFKFCPVGTGRDFWHLSFDAQA